MQKICKKHGKLTKKDLFRRQLLNGIGYYCKLCKNERHKLYRERHQIRLKPYWAKYRQTYKRKNINEINFKRRQVKKHEAFYLMDRYVKQILQNSTGLSFYEMPEIMILLKRASIMCKRFINNQRSLKNENQ